MAPLVLLLTLAPWLQGARPDSATRPSGPPAPPSRSLSEALTAQPRLAGTEGSARAALLVAGWLQAAGWEVELDHREVCLSLPRSLDLAVFPDANATRPAFVRRSSFDPDAEDPGDVPLYNAWSASGRVRAPVVDVGLGLRADYRRLRAAGVELEGRVALARYGGSYRGVKADLAQEYGLAALLLTSDSEADGALRGPVWPEGPWKPGDDQQRGAISPLVFAPGDPTTPGWPSPPPAPDDGDGTAPPGAESTTDRGARARHRPRLSDAERDARLPRIPCLPLGSDDARALLELGPAAEVALDLDLRRELRPIVNVIARLPGSGDEIVVAGNHRDAWVRGAHDAASGTVALVRAAQRLGQRARAGWRPLRTITLGFWDAEEFGLIGSTEWAEDHKRLLTSKAVAYVNADAAVSGPNFGVSGTPGLEAPLRAALERVPAPTPAGRDGTSLWDQWTAGADPPALSLPGSGSDYTVFLHHLGIPVLDVHFSGNAGGQYHTAYDDFALMDRFLDPGWRGHEAAGSLLAALLVELADRPDPYDDAAAAAAMAALVRGEEAWLGPRRTERLAGAFEDLEATIRAATEAGVPRGPSLWRLQRSGLPDRPWYQNPLWAPGIETGYAAETLPTLRAALERDEAAADIATDRLAILVELAGYGWRALQARTSGEATDGEDAPAK